MWNKVQQDRQSKPISKTLSKGPELPRKVPIKTMIKYGEESELPPVIAERKNQRVEEEKTIKPPPEPEVKPKPYDDDEIEYEEDFETIDDDEELPPPPPPKPSKQLQKPVTPGTAGRYNNSAQNASMSIEELKRAVAAENAAAMMKEKEEDVDKTVPEPIVYVRADSSVKVDVKQVKVQEKRTKDLLDIIEREKESFNLFEMLPMSKYDNMIDKLGRGVVKNSGTQYNDDRVEKDIQTEEIECKSVDSQWPQDFGKIDESKILPSFSLNKFMRRALPVVETLLEDNIKNRIQKVKLAVNDDPSAKFIASSLKIEAPRNLLSERFPNASFKVTSVGFFYTKRNYIATVYSLEEEGSLIIVWDVQNPNRPTRLLLSDSEITALCIPKNSEHIVIAGTDLGSILLWDLRESGSSHGILLIRGVKDRFYQD